MQNLNIFRYWFHFAQGISIFFQSNKFWIDFLIHFTFCVAKYYFHLKKIKMIQILNLEFLCLVSYIQSDWYCILKYIMHIIFCQIPRIWNFVKIDTHGTVMFNHARHDRPQFEWQQIMLDSWSAFKMMLYQWLCAYPHAHLYQSPVHEVTPRPKDAFKSYCHHKNYLIKE